MLISRGSLSPESLQGKVAIVTGAGRGIGLEAVKSLVWLGAKVVIAEIDYSAGVTAESEIQNQFGNNSALFVRTDIGDLESVRDLKRSALEQYRKVDIIINNATVTPIGAVTDVSIDDWDASYRVNLRGPVLLAQEFIPGMVNRRYGVFLCVSSVGHAFMGGYESFKAAQLHLAETLDAELAGTGVSALTIAPGLVRTPGAISGIKKLAPLFGKSVEEFFAMSEEHIISAEAAGAGFAAAVVFAEKFQGQEISSKQALLETKIEITADMAAGEGKPLPQEQKQKALPLVRSIRTTIAEQSEGWRERSLFERQWMIRDFKKNAGMSVEDWLESLDQLELTLSSDQDINPVTHRLPLQKLSAYYVHIKKLAAGYEKDPQKLREHTRIIDEWKNEVDTLSSILDQ